MDTNFFVLFAAILSIVHGMIQNDDGVVANVSIDRRSAGDQVSLDGCLPFLTCMNGSTAFIAGDSFICKDKVGLQKINGTQSKSSDIFRV